MTSGSAGLVIFRQPGPAAAAVGDCRLFAFTRKPLLVGDVKTRDKRAELAL